MQDKKNELEEKIKKKSEETARCGAKSRTMSGLMVNLSVVQGESIEYTFPKPLELHQIKGQPALRIPKAILKILDVESTTTRGVMTVTVESGFYSLGEKLETKKAYTGKTDFKERVCGSETKLKGADHQSLAGCHLVITAAVAGVAGSTEPQPVIGDKDNGEDEDDDSEDDLSQMQHGSRKRQISSESSELNKKAKTGDEKTK